MINPKGKSPRQATKTRQSSRRKDVAFDITAKTAATPKPAKSAAAKPSGKSVAAKPPTKGKSVKPQTSPAALRVGDKVPLASLEIKVLLDDGTTTSLGEQLERSQPGGVVVFVYSKSDDNGESEREYLHLL